MLLKFLFFQKNQERFLQKFFCDLFLEIQLRILKKYLQWISSKNPPWIIVENPTEIFFSEIFPERLLGNLPEKASEINQKVPAEISPNVLTENRP